MKIEEFRIKGMVCNRCLKVLNIELKAAGAEVIDIQLGRVVVRHDPSKIEVKTIRNIITENEFEIIWDKENILGEQIKRWVINYFWNTDLQEKLSIFLQEKLNSNYGHLSKIFSQIYGKTIERYCILLKIEKTKELIETKELTFSEIAYEVGYLNPSGLSRQFKIETGMTLKEYRNAEISTRILIDKI